MLPPPPRTGLLQALGVTVLVGVGWYLALHDAYALDPRNISWMIEGDWLGHLFGWLFARNAPWALPLAQAPDLIWPTGSSAAFTDAIPVLTVAGKLVSPFFGPSVQFFGWWMLAGVVGCGVAGVLSVRQRVTDPLQLALAGVVFVVNPVVATRYGHPPFYGMWALTGLVGANLWQVETPRDIRRVLTAVLVLDFIACGTNAYLAVMASALTGAAQLRFIFVEKRLERGESVRWLLAGPAVSLFSLWLFGFISGALSSSPDALAAEGFGQFSADPLAFFNPLQWSRFVPGFAIAGRQYEGFGYLGLGVLVLLAVRLAQLIRPSGRLTRAQWLGLAPLLVATTLCFVFALSNHVVSRQHQLVDLSFFYDKLGRLPGIFRSSGRFLWPLHITLTFVAVLAATRFPLRWQQRSALALGALLQVADLDASKTPLHKTPTTFQPFASPDWALLSEYQHLVIHPIQIQWSCPFDEKLVAKLSWEAYLRRLSINSGYVGHPPGLDCNKHLTASELRDDTIYFPYFQQFLPDFLAAGWVCGVLETTVACVSPSRETALKRALLTRPVGR